MLRSARFRWILPGAIVAAAVGLTIQGNALAEQAPGITSVKVAQVPSDPSDAAWQQPPAYQVPLIPQSVQLPRLLQVSISSVSVRSLNDGQSIGFLLEWADQTQDVMASRPDQFRDAAALMFPLGSTLPNICMAGAGQIAHLWHWKADWQNDIDQGYQDVTDAYPNFYRDFYPFATGQSLHSWPGDFTAEEARLYSPGWATGNALSQPQKLTPVEELRANGFGTATHKDLQAVDGKGTWTEGRWRVVLTRAMAPADEESINFTGRSEIPLAVAVWNGSNQEVGARKQLSSFVTLRIEGAAVLDLVPPELLTPVVFGLLVVVAAVAVAAVAISRRGVAPGS